MNVTFIQTSDLRVYRDLFDVTSKNVMEYCSRRNFPYEAYLGVKRGNQPWHATYNRIFMLHDMVQRGFRGWVCYMDADSVICDLDFSLSKYLEDKSGFAVIAARSGANPPAYWQVNIGVMMLNFEHFIARQIIEDWYLSFGLIPTQELNAASWDEVPNDQDILQLILKNRRELQPYIFIDEGPDCIINSSEARFIKQILRVDGNMQERVKQAKRAAVHALRKINIDKSDTQSQNSLLEDFGSDIIAALYRTLLLREPDPGGMQSALEIYRACGCSVERAITIILKSREFSQNTKNFIERYRSEF